jgi:ribosome biogenesis GTPase
MDAELRDPLATSPSGVNTLQGTVIAIQANYYWVQLDKTVRVNPTQPEIAFLLCTRRSRLKKIGQQVMVGDRVQIEEPDWNGQRGAIAAVLPRSSELDRPPIANATQILLVFAFVEPTLDPFQLSRFLVKAESTGLEIGLCLNKCDLIATEEQQQWSDRLQQWGYFPLIISLKQGSSLGAVRTQLQQKVTVVSGPSGVGKSSLINQLIPTIDLRVGAVSGKLSRGRHTTRHVELFELPTGGLLADTPGFNQPDLHCSPSELAGYFPEARQRLEENQCQFSNCLHRDEPNCVVRGDWERYEHYLCLLDELMVQQAAQERMGHTEATTKVKVGQEGQIQAEPKLATEKYRRPSRRTQKQGLQHWQDDLDELLDED